MESGIYLASCDRIITPWAQTSMDKVTKHLSPLHLIQEEDAEISRTPLKTNCIIKKKIKIRL